MRLHPRRDASLLPLRFSPRRTDDVPTERVSLRANTSIVSRAPEMVRDSDPGQLKIAEPERLALIGTVVDGCYHIDDVLGEGGTSLVFGATRISDGAQVAMKVLHVRYAKTRAYVRALEREAEAGRDVRAPGLVPCLDVGALEDGSPYLVFERMRGESLAQLVQRSGGLRQREAIAIVMRVGEILQSLHARGYVHRDLKPEHIFVAAGAKSRLEVFLLDLGTCSSVDQTDEDRAEAEGFAVGTPEYMSPEQALGSSEADPRTDIYSLGVVLYQLMSGRTPFECQSRRTLLDRLVCEDPPRLALIAPHVSLSLDAVVAHAIERERSGRFATMQQFMAALRPFATERVQAEQRLYWLVSERPRVAKRARVIRPRSWRRAVG